MIRARILQALAALSGKPSELSRAQARQVAREAGLTHASGGHVGREIKAWLSRAWNEYREVPAEHSFVDGETLVCRQNRNAAKRERRARRAA